MSGIMYKNRPYAGGGSGGGDTVEITPALSAGTKVADYEINGISGALYAPTPATPPDDLNDLSDVAISSPTNGQVLKYNSTSGKWENGTGGGGGGITKTQLFAQSPSQHPDTITLSDDYANYDYLEFHQYKYDDNSYYDMLEVATITKAQLEEIAKIKMPDLNAASLESAMSMIAGTCRSMGVKVAE